ncbi:MULTISPECIES: alpha/beta hydrolase [Rhodococcus]|uniref:Alpha/beta hydrolase n=1 Tax=Rhodococcus oxybenzonivorans TaxID=1990687 RepID=A0AAE4V292_9NOCA|nr:MULTISPECIES: alpha/beta hydrolase [Rhodococcus]MDV7241760.1 alpha/beta hydrolase [Rhodococcus oxybenzonivorans]MDV7267077.1 alpha/beta hydrolase [Rhodococcus oxybenzonivorans]MDV7273706.1 alpha/beta hydrolase [Rhodococcus oxybenzonivorans]MDV7334042.1 alpha/beta hydrolase [Rhodococcus oxybenzonivorans]MDV7343461.1 alpha/beta hydrolase [Rhodococcus oxybenzonivorans]
MTSFPTLDPELAAAVTMLPNLDFSDLPSARATFDSLVGSLLADLSFDGVRVQELSVPGLGDDPDVGVRFFTPENAEGPLPVLLWIHGGGFAIGTAASSDPFCVEVVRELGCAVASVEYRLAPETPFPGPLDDCYAALTHLHAHADDWGIDASRIAVGGQSAGGGLAAGTVLRARDEAVVPVAFQLLDIPELDDRLTTASMTTFVDTPLWHRPNAILSWQYYLGTSYTGPEDPNVSIYAAPARATDLRGLPPTYLCTMELDPLRDEGIDYALGLLRAGISVELHSFPGTFHGSGLLATAEVSKRAMAEALDALRRGLRVVSPAS